MTARAHLRLVASPQQDVPAAPPPRQPPPRKPKRPSARVRASMRAALTSEAQAAMDDVDVCQSARLQVAEQAIVRLRARNLRMARLIEELQHALRCEARYRLYLAGKTYVE